MPKRSHGGSAGGSKASSSVQYTKAEPAFLRRIKEQVGYREKETSLQDKVLIESGLDEDAAVDREDELPSVVVLNEGDLTREEADRADEEQKLREGKMVFRRPRDKEKKEATKRSKNDKEEREKKRKMLSFNDEEDDEDQ